MSREVWWCLAAALWLWPCALQDWRSRHVSNLWTVPAFLAAWPLAVWLGGEERLVLVFGVFAGCWLAWQMGTMGPADGKLATFLAALSPGGLALAGLVLAGWFLGHRLARGAAGRLPGVVGLYVGAALWALRLTVG